MNAVPTVKTAELLWKPLLLLVLRAAVIALLAVGIDHLLERTPAYRHFQEAGYKSAQAALMQSLPETNAPLPVVVLDLSALIQRRQAPHRPGLEEDDTDLAKEWSALSSVLQDIQAAHPRALFIDWELALPDSCVQVKPGGKDLNLSLHTDAQLAYRQLMDALAEMDAKTCPVLAIGRNGSPRFRKGQPVFPLPASSLMAVSPVLLRDPHLVYASMAALKDENGLPGAPDAVLQRIQEPAFVPGSQKQRSMESASESENDTRFGFFHSRQESEQIHAQAYWINYAYLRPLLKQTISVPPVQLSRDAAIQQQLRNRIVVLADVTEPHFTDVFPLPLDLEEAKIGLAGQAHPLSVYSGGLAHACTILTRMNQPLYAAPEGLTWLALLFAFNFGVSLIALIVSLRFAGLHDHGHEMELRRVAIDLILVFASGAFLVWFNSHTAETRILLPEYAPMLVTRLLELLAVIGLILWHLTTHKSHSEHKTGTAPAPR